jgi:hypothetical protein
MNVPIREKPLYFVISEGMLRKKSDNPRPLKYNNTDDMNFKPKVENRLKLL